MDLAASQMLPAAAAMAFSCCLYLLLLLRDSIITLLLQDGLLGVGCCGMLVGSNPHQVDAWDAAASCVRLHVLLLSLVRPVASAPGYEPPWLSLAAAACRSPGLLLARWLQPARESLPGLELCTSFFPCLLARCWCTAFRLFVLFMVSNSGESLLA